jgi:predicted DNA-binding transcriptional regulator AlpA
VGESRQILGNSGINEHFVDAAKVAEVLSVSRKHILRLSKQGRIPAHPISFGQRSTWRYLLSEIRDWALGKHTDPPIIPRTATRIELQPGSPRKGGR